MNSLTVQVSDELLQYLEELSERCSMSPEELIESNLRVLMNRTHHELFPPDPNPAPTPSGWLRSVVYPAKVAQS